MGEAMPLVLSAFHARNEPPAMLRRKVEVSLRYVDRLLVILDRWPEGVNLGIEFLLHVIPNRLTVLHDAPADPARVSGLDEWGRPQCEEGRLRQLAWDWCVEQAADQPSWFVFGDTDEILTPDAIDFFRKPPEDDGTDVYLLDLINLWGSEEQYLGGFECPYSPYHPESNKRGAIVRYRPGREYARYPDQTHHVRVEPAGLKAKWIKFPKVLHYKWADLARWSDNPQSKTEKYRRYLEKFELIPTPRSWLWE
jgi:hypothetical protein